MNIRLLDRTGETTLYEGEIAATQAPANVAWEGRGFALTGVDEAGVANYVDTTPEPTPEPEPDPEPEV